MGSPWGPGRPGWHIECSAMAEKLLGPSFEIHGGGLDLVFPHHENELAQSSALGHEFARIWMHNGMLRFTGEKMSKSVGSVETIQEVLDKWGRETTLLFFLTAHWRARSTSPTSGWSRRGHAPTGFARCFATPLSLRRKGPGSVSLRFSTMISPRPRRWRCCTSGGITRCCGVGSTCSGSGRSRSFSRRRQRSTSSLVAVRRRARRATSPSRTAFAPRSRLRGGDPGRRGRLPARAEDVTREQVYGRRPVREALRGPREVLELWATERAAAGEPWLADGPRVQVKPDRELSDAAGTRDHQGVLAWCEPYRYADAHELAGAETPLLACLDQVTDPRNFGAVCRSAEGAGASGVIVPAHGSAGVTAAVCRSSAGAVEHLPVAVVPNLARFLMRSSAATFGSTPLPPTPRRTCGRRICLEVSHSSSARRAKASVRSSAGPVRRDRDPAGRPGRVAERQCRRLVASVRSPPAAQWLTRRATGSNGSAAEGRSYAGRRRDRRWARAPMATTTRNMTTLCVYFCAADVSPTRG